MDNKLTARSRQRLVSLNFRVPMEFRKRLRIRAAERGVTMTCLVLELLAEAMQDSAGEPRNQDSHSTGRADQPVG